VGTLFEGGEAGVDFFWGKSLVAKKQRGKRRSSFLKYGPPWGDEPQNEQKESDGPPIRDNLTWKERTWGSAAPLGLHRGKNQEKEVLGGLKAGRNARL